VFDGPLEDAEEAGIFGEVVGLDAEVLAQFGDDLAFGVFDDCAVAGGAGLPREPPSQWAVKCSAGASGAGSGKRFPVIWF